MNSIDFNKKLEKNFFTLYQLAELGCIKRYIKISTEILAKKLKISQQTASRRLIVLEKIGWIERISIHNGTSIKITNSGKQQFIILKSNLNLILQKNIPSITIEGEVFTGLGEGAYYVNQKYYKNQFIEKLGFEPYPGTLNIKINNEYKSKLISEIETYQGILIEGFKKKDRTFGSVKCFHSLINNREKGAVVFAFRSYYKYSVLEIIAPTNLRKELKLKDGNNIKVKIFLIKK